MKNAAPRPFVVYALCIALAGLGLLVASWGLLAPGLPLLILLAVTSVVAEVLAVELPDGGTVSISYPLSVAALALLGPTAGALVAVSSGVSIGDFRGKRPLSAVVFNTGQILLSAVASGLLYMSFGGRQILLRPLVAADFPRILVAVIALAGSSFLLNALLVTVALATRDNLPFRKVWESRILWMAPTQIVLALLGVALAQVIALVGPIGMVVCVVPLALARLLYREYLRLRRASVDTVRGLVAALEAKDEYTAGHSERVAEYAVGIVRQMGLSASFVQQMEIAALLHDLGKVGVSQEILHKPGALTDAEFDRIKQHPELGANIIESAPFLDEIIPWVRYHHERFDGRGYGTGIKGDEIPLGARILAVADSFDAMTSNRPYRPAMNRRDALAELWNCVGSQFDPSAVQAFSQMLISNLEMVGPASESELTLGRGDGLGERSA